MSLSFSPEIAKEVGLEEAIFLHHICFWVKGNREVESIKHYKKDRYWTFNSDTTFSKDWFPWWTPNQIKRIRRNLKKAGYIDTGSFNAFGPDKTTWYTYTDKVYDTLGIKYIEKISTKKRRVKEKKTEAPVVEHEEVEEIPF